MAMTSEQLKTVREQMTVQENPGGDLPITVIVPRELIPTDVEGPLKDAEGGARLARLLLERSWEAAANANESGKPAAIKEAAKGSQQFFDMWLSVELSFAGLLLKRGKQLKGRSMIAVM